MAVGLPLKTTYANGDVYSASDVNDITGTVNLLQTSTLSSQAGKNAVINGGMDVWQRGTSITTGNYVYTADRWQTWNNTVYTVSRQATSDTTNLPNIQYCLRFQRNSGSTSTTSTYLAQTLESVNSIPFSGKAITFSFYARKGANYSGTSSTIPFQLRQGTGTDQNVIAGMTGGSDVINSSATLTTTWQRFTYSATVSSSATQLGFYFIMTGVGTAGAADYFEITGVQIELGSYATTFSRAGGSLGGELALCQRYYEKSINLATTPGTTSVGEWWFPNATIANGETYHLINFAVTKRTDPTVTTYSYSGTSGRAANDSGTNYGADSANVWRAYETYAIVKNNSGSSMTVTSVRWIYCNWTASAEL